MLCVLTVKCSCHIFRFIAYTEVFHLKKHNYFFSLIPIYTLTLIILIAGSIYTNKAVNTISEHKAKMARKIIVIDAGHGGEDGGATSCTGVLESHINLEIATQLNDLFRIIGYQTVMIRNDYRSVYTSGKTIAARKVSDLRQRVNIVNDLNNAYLISIHQNYFPDKKYSGAQVFYNNNEDSKKWGLYIQNQLIQHLNPGSTRQSKPAKGIYLMEHVNCPAVLIECGFLSNPSEEALLRNNDYQSKLCCIVISACSRFWLENTPVA